MKKGSRFAFLSLLLVFVLVSVSSLMLTATAVVIPKSTNVICVPDRSCSNGGTLPNTGFPNSDTFVFTNVAPSTIADGAAPNPLTGNDTVMLLTSDFSFQTYWADSDFSGRITQFVQNGGKLIIYDSESTTSDFSGFIYPFTASSPGAYGASTPVVNVFDNTLSSNNSADSSYVQMSLLTSTDAGGDANTMVTYNSNWYIDMVATNVLGVNGPVHTYAFYGSGMIIYNGLDIDYASSTTVNNLSGTGVLGMIWYLELCGQNIGAGVSVSGLTLSPKTAANPLGTAHTVTATVTDNLAQPISGKTVDFEITAGPNMGLTGSGVSDAQGQVTFSWSSSTVGTDEVTATITLATGQPVSDTATKDWIPGNQIPEVPLGTIAISAAMLIGLCLFIARGKITRTPKT